MKMTGARKDDSRFAEYVQKGKEEAQERIEAARDTTAGFIDARADEVGDALDRLSDALRGASEVLENAGARMGQRGELAAERVDRASAYLHKNDHSVFFEDIGEFSRRHVGWTIGIAFAAGVIAARLAKH